MYHKSAFKAASTRVLPQRFQHPPPVPGDLGSHDCVKQQRRAAGARRSDAAFNRPLVTLRLPGQPRLRRAAAPCRDPRHRPSR